MPATLYQAPASEPVSIPEVRAFLRIDGEQEDALLAALVRSARTVCESFIGKRLLRAEYSEDFLLSQASHVRLGERPFHVLTLAQLERAQGGFEPLSEDEYRLDETADGSVEMRVLTPYSRNDRLHVRYRAGSYDDWNQVPEPIRHGLMRMVAHFHTHRDSMQDDRPPAIIAALWRPYRMLRLDRSRP